MDHSTAKMMVENLLPYFNNSLKFTDSIINAKDDLHVLSSRLILLVFVYTIIACYNSSAKVKNFVNLMI